MGSLLPERFTGTRDEGMFPEGVVLKGVGGQSGGAATEMMYEQGDDLRGNHEIHEMHEKGIL